ncbi:MAG: AMP-binding protein [Thermomicrobiales bacterium]
MAEGFGRTGHVDTFARDNLPPRADWPTFDAPLTYPARLNCAAALLDAMADGAGGDRPALHFDGRTITYRELLATVNRIAHVLSEDLGVVPGNRVLLRGPNNPMLVACWFAVLKAGAIAVTTMPLLRTRELTYVMTKARVTVALCDGWFADEMHAAAEQVTRGESGLAPRVCCYHAGDHPDTLEALSAGKPDTFENIDTASDDVALIAFTSGSTGQAKGTMHFHRDVLAICDCFSQHILQPGADDVFCGTPPLGFTFALGGLVLFPFQVGASTVLIEQPSPTGLLDAIQRYAVTTLFTAPTMYRRLCGMVKDYDLRSLRACVSAGETLPLATYHAWQEATGITLIDGIGATEMLHIFISAAGDDIRPGATGKPVPGYAARIVDDDGNELPPGSVGRLAVRGPTGCRYLADPERQRGYVQGGWNLTGDMYRMDADGYFWYQARADDMIISSGYNIAGPEVENVLREHPKVQECAVVGLPDAARGQLVTAFIVLRNPTDATPETVTALQDFVKAEIAPYKYPRAVEFVTALPYTETGKLQRFRLRQGIDA